MARFGFELAFGITIWICNVIGKLVVLLAHVRTRSTLKVPSRGSKPVLLASEVVPAQVLIFYFHGYDDTVSGRCSPTSVLGTQIQRGSVVRVSSWQLRRPRLNSGSCPLNVMVLSKALDARSPLRQENTWSMDEMPPDAVYDLQGLSRHLQKPCKLYNFQTEALSTKAHDHRPPIMQ